MTTRDLAERVRKERQPAWDRADPTQAVVWTQKLNPDDEEAVRRAVDAAGFVGVERDERMRQVAALMVGQVTALDDSQPADGANGKTSESSGLAVLRRVAGDGGRRREADRTAAEQAVEVQAGHGPHQAGEHAESHHFGRTIRPRRE